MHERLDRYVSSLKRGSYELYIYIAIVSSSTHVHYRNRFCFLLLGEMNLGLNPMRNRLSELIEPLCCMVGRPITSIWSVNTTFQWA